MLAATLVSTLVAFAQRSDSPEVMLGAGLHQEEVEGNCKAAIEIYQKITLQKDAPLRVAARAQLHIGTCQERLGQNEARKAYELVLTRYADQTEIVAEARARIAALGGGSPLPPGAGLTNRRVWTRDPNSSLSLAVSADGRYIAYVDGNQQRDLFLHDLASSRDRRLTRNPDLSAYARSALFSRDGKRLVYSRRDESKQRFELLIVNLEEPGVPRSVPVPAAEAYAQSSSLVRPQDWSPDGATIALAIQRLDETQTPLRQIVLVNVRDGSVRIIRSGVQARFSPDGKFLAYGVFDPNPTRRNDISVVPLGGGAEIPVVADPANDILVGWAPDGKQLLFTSDRTGKRSLYVVALNNGRPQGVPVLVRPDFAFDWVGLTASGKLYYEVADVRGIYGDIKFASYDFDAERFIEPPVLGVKDFVGHNAAADWSPDGKYLLNISDRKGQQLVSDGQVLVIHSADTGEFVRELRSGLILTQGIPWPRWAADSKSIAAPAMDPNSRRQGIYRIDAESGQATPLVLSQAGESVRGPAFSPDGKKFLYTRVLPNLGRGPEQRAIMERDLETGLEKEIMRGDTLTVVLFSPDGRYFTTVRTDDKASVLLLVPTNGGEPKELMRVDVTGGLPPAGTTNGLWVEFWAPDSRSVYVGKLPEPIETWWRVSIDTGERRTVTLDQNMGLSVRVHPDGRRLAYSVQSQRTQTELWVLENFLSALKSRN
jgi:Tol biopolymer transport system component